MDKKNIIIYSLIAVVLALGAYFVFSGKKSVQEGVSAVTASDTLYKRIVYVESDTTIKVDNNTKIVRVGLADKETKTFTQVNEVTVTLSDGKILNKADIVAILDKK